MRCRTILAVVTVLSMSLAMSGCGGASETANTTTAATVAATEAATSATVEEIDPAIYKMTGGLWYYTGAEDEKSIDMDGLKGFTTYTAEAIPEYEGYLQYLGENSDGLHTFDVLDMSGRQFMTLTFVSEEQFYIDDDEKEYYVKWDY